MKPSRAEAIKALALKKMAEKNADNTVLLVEINRKLDLIMSATGIGANVQEKTAHPEVQEFPEPQEPKAEEPKAEEPKAETPKGKGKGKGK